MERRFALPVLAALSLAALFGSLPLRAAGDTPKPGTIVSVAGTGNAGYGGDNGPATQAPLNGPWGLALDAAGNLFIADVYNSCVRRVDAVTGIITTVAGNGKNQPYAGDGGPATETGFRSPFNLAIDAGGNLFISDHSFPHTAPYDERVLKVYGVAAPGLLAGMPFPIPKQP